ncbi:hypothetical protein FM996_15360 [Methylosinus sporium]|uniref:Uncharacterized protein n=1 Tax=Methylosinus sporium TaxID=428 RepID=A0A549SMJ4_METSR|nr:hypothetical protein [Methylosinus sporium]TRL30835.1 hypothetical protein FM996_15360 [Methylosinus sporium]
MNINVMRAAMLGCLISQPVNAECPDPFPQSPSADQIRECLSDVAKLRIEVLRLRVRLNSISGHYNGAGLDSLTPESRVRSSIAGKFVRISFDSYNFKSLPVVLLTTREGWHVYIHDITNDHVDVLTQTIDDGRANGSMLTDKEFWFQIVPTAF